MALMNTRSSTGLGPLQEHPGRPAGVYSHGTSVGRSPSSLVRSLASGTLSWVEVFPGPPTLSLAARFVVCEFDKPGGWGSLRVAPPRYLLQQIQASMLVVLCGGVACFQRAQSTAC